MKSRKDRIWSAQVLPKHHIHLSTKILAIFSVFQVLVNFLLYSWRLFLEIFLLKETSCWSLPDTPLKRLWLPPICSHFICHQSWIFIGRTDAEAPILWPPDAKNWLTRKDPDVGKDWRQRKKGTTEDEMVGWHHWLDGHEFEQALGVGDGQGSLVCCSPWGLKESDMTDWLNWTDLLLCHHPNTN